MGDGTRTVTKTLPKGYRATPSDLLREFKEAGFRFDSETCPFKFSQPWSQRTNADGSVTYTQQHRLQ